MTKKKQKPPQLISAIACDPSSYDVLTNAEELAPEVQVITDTRPGGIVRGTGEGMSIGQGTIRNGRP